MSFSAYYPYESRETVRNRLKNKEYVTRQFKGRSSVWTSFLVVTTTDGVPVNYVICKDCSEVFTYKGHSSGTSTLRKHVVKCIERKYGKLLKFPDEIESALKSTHILLQGEIPNSSNVHFLGDDRKPNVASSAGGSLAPGLDESSAGSGEGPAGCDEVSVPLSPEQFLSEDMDRGTSPGTPSSQRPESYKLRHNNHLTLVLESLAGDESFMDVTLTAQGKAIKAHKSVLSAVSPYFRSVLKQNPCQHPIIIMPRDVRFDELSNIISYVYKGEMTVAAEDLSSLLKTAEVLQVTGLSPSEGSSGPGGIMSQMQGLPTGVFPSTSTSSSSSSSKTGTKKTSKQTSHTTQVATEEMSQASVCSEAQGKIDPLEFLNADMTCVKEEIQSENEETEDSNFGLSMDTSETVPNLPESVETSPNRRRSVSSPSRSLEDPTGKPFNPGEPGGSTYSEEDTSESPPPITPYVCPHCLETHRPNDALHSHLRLKHPSKPSFVCACARVFVRQSVFAEHGKICTF